MRKLLLALAFASVVPACDAGSTVEAVAVGINRNSDQPGVRGINPIHSNVKSGTGNRFSNVTINSLTQVSGTYTHCALRNGMWAVAVDSYTGALDWPKLSVVRNDAGCILTVSQFETSNAGQQFPIPAGSGIVLDTSYPATPVAFASHANDTAPNFYANAEMNIAHYTNNFVITIPFSDNPNLATGTVTGVHTVSASADSLRNPAPNYTMDLSGIAIEEDTNNIITSMTGTSTLTRDPTKGTVFQYTVLSSVVADDYGSIDAAWKSVGHSSPTSTDPMVMQAADFGISVGADLTAGIVRTVILATDWTNPTYGFTTSYQKFTVTFNP